MWLPIAKISQVHGNRISLVSYYRWQMTLFDYSLKMLVQVLVKLNQLSSVIKWLYSNLPIRRIDS